MSSSTDGTLAANRPAMERFLSKLRDSGNVRLSCQAAGVPRRTVYNWRKQWKSFAEEWDEALEEACDILEATAWQRAVKEGSDRLLMFLLTAHRRDVYGQRVAVCGVPGEPIEHVHHVDEETLRKALDILGVSGRDQSG